MHSPRQPLRRGGIGDPQARRDLREAQTLSESELQDFTVRRRKARECGLKARVVLLQLRRARGLLIAGERRGDVVVSWVRRGRERQRLKRWR